MRGERGFTFLEMFVAILILGILSALAAVRFNSFAAGNQLEKAAWNVMKTMSLARPIAMKNDCQVRITFSVNNQYKIHTDLDNDWATDAGEPVQTFNLDSPVRFGLPATPPGAAPAGAALPAAGSWRAGNWANQNVRISSDALGTINSGCVYICSTRLSKLTYCIAALTTNNSQNLKMFRWNGSSWIAL